MGKSNDNGRALEYAVTKSIMQHYPKALVDERTHSYQLRDQTKFDSLGSHIQAYFIKNSEYFVAQILPTRLNEGNQPIEINRLGDDEGIDGDVTDIRLKLSCNSIYNISLKHNHEAVKHQRPGALIKQLGLEDKVVENEYKGKIKDIEQSFYSALLPQENRFDLVKKREPLIITQLYRSICDNAIDYINCNSGCARHLFTFLIGKNNFEKVIMTKNQIEVLNFYNLPLPTEMQANRFQDSYLDLHFNNGISFRSRLHTASSRIEVGKSISLKFDTNLLQDKFNFINRLSVNV